MAILRKCLRFLLAIFAILLFMLYMSFVIAMSVVYFEKPHLYIPAGLYITLLTLVSSPFIIIACMSGWGAAKKVYKPALSALAFITALTIAWVMIF